VLHLGSELVGSLGVDGKTVAGYLDMMVDLLLVRRLPPLHANLGKRLVKRPKVYLRDSGLLAALLRIEDLGQLLGHPVCGMSWKGFVIESLLAATPPRTEASFYRTAAGAGAEIDLVLDLPRARRWALEIKLGHAPKLSRGFRTAVADLAPEQTFCVHYGSERYPVADGIEVIGLGELAEHLTASA
jgi:predicted AAA+ superfamily ATPase